MEKKEAKELLDKYLNGTCTPEEKVLFEGLSNAVLKKHLADSTQPNYRALKAAIYRNLPKPDRKARPFKWYYAAAALLIIGFGIFFIAEKTERTHSIKPGNKQPMLTLADGKTISLDSAQSGIIIGERSIHYQNGNNVLADKGLGLETPGNYNPDKSGQAVKRTTYNSLSTPNGGQYQVILEDRTKVWLNSATTLKYPSHFNGKKREVEISGEAFFEVSNVKDKPFYVKSRGQFVHVLGTSFNISGYETDESIKTTLVSGAIQVAIGPDFRLLKSAGQQVINHHGIISIKTVNTEDVTAWKKGYFALNNKSFEDILKEMGRWYDLDIIYNKETIPHIQLFGECERSKDLSIFLNMLESNQVAYRLEGRKMEILGKRKK